MLFENNLSQSSRVLIYAPYGRDGLLIHKELEKAGYAATVCSSVEDLCHSITEGAGAALIGDESLVPSAVETLADQLASQPPWSDVPLLVMTSGGASTNASRYRLSLLGPLGNVTLLERPLRPVTLVSSVSAALRARRHQYQLSEHLTRIETSERALRHSEARFRFLSELGDAIRSVKEPDQTAALVTRRLAEHLRVSRCVYGAVEPGSEYFTILQNEANGVNAIRKHRLSHLGPRFVAAMRAGRTIVIHDVKQELSPYDDRTSFSPFGVEAFVCCPLLKDGLLVAMLAVQQTAPRNWTDDEVELIKEVVERCWASIERERLVAEVARNNEILQRTNKELLRANRELEEFAYAASHDLQEPLRMVKIYSQLILQRLGGGADEELRQFADLLQHGAGRMEDLVTDLLTFSRTVHLESHEAGAADLAVSLGEALAVLKTRIDESGAAIHAQSLPVVQGDARQLAHVFQNLISNSIKYRKPTEAPQICISAAQEDGQWTITVRDNGIGFEQRYAERIFGLFKRLHKDEYPGTGLGLAICQRIVERYGGRMWASGQVGVGATFYFSLPAARNG